MKLEFRASLSTNVNTKIVTKDLSLKMTYTDSDGTTQIVDVTNRPLSSIIDELSDDGWQFANIGTNTWDEFNLRGSNVTLYFEKETAE